MHDNLLPKYVTRPSVDTGNEIKLQIQINCYGFLITVKYCNNDIMVRSGKGPAHNRSEGPKGVPGSPDFFDVRHYKLGTSSA
jgi:hypothetical protein